MLLASWMLSWNTIRALTDCCWLEHHCRFFSFFPFQFSFLVAFIAVYIAFLLIPFKFFLLSLSNIYMCFFLGITEFLLSPSSRLMYALCFTFSLKNNCWFLMCRIILKNYGHYSTSCYLTYSIHQRTSLNGLISHLRVLEITQLMK